MRGATRSLIVAGALCLTNGAAACPEGAEPCADAEPMWLTPSAGDFALVSDPGALDAGELGATATFAFRLRPAVLTVPAPSAAGRDVNLIRHATDVSLGGRLGIGRRMEISLALPAGLYQRGAGIKGVTHQSAPPIPRQSLHDPRVGFGYAFDSSSRRWQAKLRLELKLPLGSAAALSGEDSFVTSPSLALLGRAGGFVAAAELGARLRRPTDFFGSRIGTQALLAAAAGYELPSPKLALSLEGYALPSLIRAGRTSYAPAEWLASLRYTPGALPRLSFGVGGGGALPLSSSDGASFAGFGTPALRVLTFVRLAPAAS